MKIPPLWWWNRPVKGAKKGQVSDAHENMFIRRVFLAAPGSVSNLPRHVYPATHLACSFFFSISHESCLQNEGTQRVVEDALRISTWVANRFRFGTEDGIQSGEFLQNSALKPKNWVIFMLRSSFLAHTATIRSTHDVQLNQWSGRCAMLQLVWNCFRGLLVLWALQSDFFF